MSEKKSALVCSKQANYVYRLQKLDSKHTWPQPLKARTLILVFNWVCAIVLSYTIALNVKDLGGNVFANHTFSLLMSAVGILFSNLLIVKQGNKNT